MTTGYWNAIYHDPLVEGPILPRLLLPLLGSELQYLDPSLNRFGKPSKNPLRGIFRFSRNKQEIQVAPRTVRPGGATTKQGQARIRIILCQPPKMLPGFH